MDMMQMTGNANNVPSIGQRALLLFSLFALALFVGVTLSVPAMSYEEPKYTIVKQTNIYEVRRYQKRTVAEIV
ncbi:MAG: hypothetical protein EBT20_21655, partial [Alphaproteobacteria bacterium]|nr:hypothetical protein [Alphaproteobacteria bacterium]